MKVIVLGAGIIGVSTAWYLAKSGHDVVVVDRQSDAALETSFANGAQISVCFCEPWASKSAPLKMLKWMTQPDSPLLFRVKLDPQQWRWGLSFLGQCNDAAFARNVKQLVSLGRYSQNALHEIVADTGIEYNQVAKGILYYFTTESGLDGGIEGTKLMREYGVDRRVMTRDEVVAIEPNLKSFGSKITGGTYTPTDESGDAKVFVQELVKRCKALGVEFAFDSRVDYLTRVGGEIGSVQVTHLPTNHVTQYKGDAYVAALGPWTAPLLRTVGQSLNIYPAKGYSATLRLLKPELASTVSLLDDERKIAISRLGDHVRIAGTAELNGYDSSLSSNTAKLRCGALIRRYEEVFPGVADLTEPNYWTGLRPSTPDNIPYIGRSKLGKLWLNTGHGTLGWTHGAGSGKALAELMNHKKPDLAFGFC